MCASCLLVFAIYLSKRMFVFFLTKSVKFFLKSIFPIFGEDYFLFLYLFIPVKEPESARILRKSIKNQSKIV